VRRSRTPRRSPTHSRPSRLNALAGKKVEQKFRLTVDKGANPGVKFGPVTDVVLGVEYTADLK
jgi:hypothetical protein